MSETNNDRPEENLSESWFEMGFRSQMESDFRASPSPIKTATVSNVTLEKLLLEAQKESSKSSHIDSLASSRGSPRSQHSPNTDRAISPSSADAIQQDIPETDWVWDWSSRPEIIPQSNGSSQYRHPSAKRRNLSIRNTRLMQGITATMENLPLLILTHACSFFLGAATMMICMKRYCKLPVISSTMID